MYAVSGDCLEKHVGTFADVNTWDMSMVIRGTGGRAALLSSGQSLADRLPSAVCCDSDVYIGNVVDNPDEHGAAVSAGQDALGKRLAAMLEATVGEVSVNGRHAALRVSYPRILVNSYQETFNPYGLLH